MTAPKSSASAIIAGGILATLIEVAIVTGLLWAGLRGIHHLVSFWTVACLVAALLVFLRSAFARWKS